MPGDPLSIADDFKVLLRHVMSALRALYLSRTALKRFETLSSYCEKSIVLLWEHPELAPADSPPKFLDDWILFIRELSNHFSVTALLRSGEFFLSEIPLIRSSLLVFSGPFERTAVNNILTTLQQQLVTFKVRPERIPEIEATIASLQTVYDECRTNHGELVRRAKSHLAKVLESLDEFCNGEPKAAAFKQLVDQTTDEFNRMFSIGPLKRKIYIPEYISVRPDLPQKHVAFPQKPLPPPQKLAASLQKPAASTQKPTPSNGLNIPAQKAPPRQAADLEALRQQIEDEKRRIGELNERLHAFSARWVLSDLRFAISRYNESLVEMNARMATILADLRAGKDSRTVLFWSDQLRTSNRSLREDIQKAETALHFIEARRNSQVHFTSDTPADYLNALTFLRIETDDIQQEIESISAAIGLRHSERIESVRAAPIKFIEQQFERLRSEIQSLPKGSAPLKVPSFRGREPDRSIFDPAFEGIRRMNDIQVQYHSPTAGLRQDQREQLVIAYSELHREFNDVRDFYETFIDLSTGLTDARLNSTELLQTAESAVSDALETIENREEAMIELARQLIRQSCATGPVEFGDDQEHQIKTLLVQRIDDAQRLKDVDDWMTTSFAQLDGQEQNMGLLRRIPALREAIATPG